MLDRVRMDVRYALRLMGTAPGFTGAVVLFLALGIGASTAIYGAVDHILFRPLDYPASDRIVTLCEAHENVDYCSVSPTNVTSWSEQSGTVEAMGVARGENRLVSTGDGLRGITVALVTPGLFDVLGAAPTLGRPIRDEDMLPAGDAHVVVLTHGFWVNELGGDPDVLSRTLSLDGETYRIVGVLAEGLVLPRVAVPELLVPLPFEPGAERNRGWRGFRGFGRLAPGSSVAAAAAELSGIEARLAEVYPEALRGWSVDVIPLQEMLVRNARPLLLLLLGSVVAVLLIVAVNLAGLLLARATARDREFAIRIALGAEPVALVRQLTVESAAMVLLGGLGGILLALWGTSAFVALAPPGIPRIDEVTMDGRILAFGLTVTVLTALTAGLAPATRVRIDRLADRLRERSGGRGRREHGLRRALVVTQLGLALVLLLSSLLLMRSFSTLAGWDPGFELDGLLTFRVYPGRVAATAEEVVSYWRLAKERLEAIPGVEAVGTASSGPLFGGGDGGTPVLVEGRPEVPIQEAPRIAWYDAGPGYFPALGMPVLRGRNLSEADRLGSTPTALVNEAMARRFWTGESPLGARLSLPDWRTVVEVVGVVPDMRPLEPGDPAVPAIYVSNRQYVRGASFIVVRTGGDPGSLAPAVRDALHELSRVIEPVEMMTMRERLGLQLTRPRFDFLLVGLLAVVALVLGAVGIYGVVAFAVTQRSREFGIRMALGAGRADILRSVMLEGLRMLGWGLLLGLSAAVFTTRLLRDLLQGVGPSDPWALAGTLVLLALSALAAVIRPAFRASRTDPIAVIRME